MKKTPGSDWPVISEYVFPEDSENDPYITEEQAEIIANRRIMELQLQISELTDDYIDVDEAEDSYEREERFAIQHVDSDVLDDYSDDGIDDAIPF